MRKYFIFVSLLCASAGLAESQAKEPLAAFPSDTIQVTTVTALQPTDTVQVNLAAASEQCAVAPAQPSRTPPACPNIGPIAVEGPAQKSFSFSLPPNACVGLYSLTATATAAPEPPTQQTPKPSPPSPRNIDISSPQYVRVNEKPPAVTGLSRRAIYRDDVASWSLVFLGPTLRKASDYSLRFADHALPLCAADPKKGPSALIDPKDSEVSCFRPDAAASLDGQIAFDVGGKLFFSEFKGKQSVSLVRNGAESTPQELYVVSAKRTTPRNYAIVITMALVVLIYVLLYSAHATTPSESGKGSYLFTALLLDEETQTYSLAKCQFYGWTLAAVLGYIFFAVARSVVQGSPEFPDIPGGLPGILLFSAGTSVLATGITTTKGSKGAGQVHPTLADFITTGGVVAPERLQFVVWTVVGIVSFLTIVFKSDPLTLSTLPKIPDGFLQLMGISSAGYLGGKFARRAGPVIKGIMVDSITKTGDQTLLTLKLTGENLDPKAKIKIDGQPIRDSLFQVTGTPDPQHGFCTELTVVVREAAAYVVNTHTLTLVNSDSQSADVIFPVDPMIFNPVTVPHATTLQKVEITGERFAAIPKGQTFARWKDAAGTAEKLPSAECTSAPTTPAVVFNTSKSLSAWLVPGATPGEGQLTVFSPVGLGYTAKVTVT